MTDPTPRLAETSDADITLVREWLTDLDANIDNPYDTQMCDTVRAVLADRDRLAARVAELEAYADSLTGAVKAASDFGDAMDRIRQLPGQAAATATANAEIIGNAMRQLRADGNEGSRS